MLANIRKLETWAFGRIGYTEATSTVARIAFWLAISEACLILLSFLHGALGDVSSTIAILLSPFVFLVLLILFWRYLMQRLLWTVRNRLILTSLLMGLAPIVLFATLAAISAYTFSGQFATNTAIGRLHDETGRLRDRATAATSPLAHLLELQQEHPRLVPPPDARQIDAPKAGATQRREAGLDAAISVNVWVDGHSRDTASRPAATAKLLTLADAKETQPAWLQPGFSGVLEEHGRLYLGAAVGGPAGDHTVLGLASTPLNAENLGSLAESLGSISIFHTFDTDESPDSSQTSRSAAKRGRAETADQEFSSVGGGRVPPSQHFFDGKVVFTAPLPITSWQSGQNVHAMLGVVSRPTLLYSQLFATSVHIGTLVRNGLIGITIFFGVLELLAFLLAIRLSRTITQSIADLYEATTQIDRGRLEHRIPVRRKDQLGSLATSFNTMTGSLAELLVQQREKQRMQSELAIAQEVQNNLFPHSPTDIPGFELHGICKPARTVSGDYYDFILSGGKSGSEQLCLALGDISGKGISAALLMASLHSAVRAYHSGEPQTGDALQALQGDGTPAEGFSKGPSPGRLLGRLNRHLYSSTQPEKYATLFLACYDCNTRQLTYSNGGHLTPLLLCADGRIQRLECGGSVVGLLDGLEYAECTVQLQQGDLLVIYSDGVTEPENEFGEFGEERLLETVRQHSNQPLSEIAAVTMRALEHWIGESEQPDDVTLVLARQL
jgi:sigma-B regulation protein RsbU (phosphoserine phosphatase)